MKLEAFAAPPVGRQRRFTNGSSSVGFAPVTLIATHTKQRGGLRWRDPSGLDYCIKSQLASRYIVDENGVWHHIWSGRVEWEESTNPLFQVVKFLVGLLPDTPAPPGSIVTVRVGPVTA